MRKALGRIIAVIPAVLLQALWLLLLMSWLEPFAALLNLVLTFLAFIFVLYIISSRNESAYKTLWLLVILGLPILGTVLYLFLGNKSSAAPLRKRFEKAKRDTGGFPDRRGVSVTGDKRISQIFESVEQSTGFVTMPLEDAEYFPLGEDMWKRMLDELENAEQFIFAEYFIIEPGRMWDTITEVLERKAAAGVDVRVMFDDMGSFSTYSAREVKALESRGIKCAVFNPLVMLRGTLNYRDHRKMLVIDGKTAFSGGVNLADEYINSIVKYGHWKDIGYRISGAPVRSFTEMFVEFWNAFSNSPIPPSALNRDIPDITDNGSYILSYYDSPIGDKAVSNDLYIELLSIATERAWFYTPYLMLGDALMDAFIRAAKRGVDVRIIMPGIPDKKTVFRMSQSFYPDLLKAGVKIYEYAPGFVHAKACVIDDRIGTIGTVNLDYRSLFLHFENNSLFFNADILSELKSDFEKTRSECREITKDNIKMSFGKWCKDSILRIFAPLC